MDEGIVGIERGLQECHDGCVVRAYMRPERRIGLRSCGDWISECNGNIPACWDARKAIREAKRASPLDCLGRVQSHEAATAA